MQGPVLGPTGMHALASSQDACRLHLSHAARMKPTSKASQMSDRGNSRSGRPVLLRSLAGNMHASRGLGIQAWHQEGALTNMKGMPAMNSWVPRSGGGDRPAALQAASRGRRAPERHAARLAWPGTPQAATTRLRAWPIIAGGGAQTSQAAACMLPTFRHEASTQLLCVSSMGDRPPLGWRVAPAVVSVPAAAAAAAVTVARRAAAPVFG